MRVIHTGSFSLAVGLAAMGAAYAEPQTELSVVASIKPIHGLVAAVMGDVGTPALLVQGAGSPHNYALRPSQARNVQNADVVFWVGEPLERFLDKALETIGANANAVALSQIDGIKTLKFRDIKVDKDDHSDHGDKDDHDQHEDHADHDKHEDHADHNHDKAGIDPHIWLDPDNARIMVLHIADVLSVADARNADTYAQNAAGIINAIEALSTEIEGQLAPYSDAQFVVFHDAYHYFEDRFGLEASAAITVSPETPPGAERVRDIQNLLADKNVTCIFDEPQFEPRIITTIIGDADIKRATLDPLGVDLPAGPDFYPGLIRALSTSFAQCLAAES